MAEQTRALTKQEAQFKNLAQVLTGDAMRKQIAAALPKTITPERLTRVVLSTVQRVPKLLECEPKSFLAAVMACAALGLEPDGLLGQAYLVPFKDKCTVIPGYQGLMKLARQSGEIASIDAHPVRVGDLFDYRYGADPGIKHVPAERPYTVEGSNLKWAEDWRPGEITHFYAVAKMRDGSVAFVVMPSWEVDQIRDGSQGYQAALKYNQDSSPWSTDYDRMGCKTAIRRLCKYLPASVEDHRLHRAIALDERADRGADQDLGSFVDIGAMPDLAPMAKDAPAPRRDEEGRRMKLGDSGGAPRLTIDTSAVPPEPAPEPEAKA
jgi:recombination protein RecT